MNMPSDVSAEAARIRELNDAFRTELKGTGTVLLTAGLIALGRNRQLEILAAVQSFNTFSEDNDPYGEHDFGAFKIAGESLFWKIDYYDPTQTAGSDDPADPKRTHRVLTIMLASEW